MLRGGYLEKKKLCQNFSYQFHPKYYAVFWMDAAELRIVNNKEYENGVTRMLIHSLLLQKQFSIELPADVASWRCQLTLMGKVATLNLQANLVVINSVRCPARRIKHTHNKIIKERVVNELMKRQEHPYFRYICFKGLIILNPVFSVVQLKNVFSKIFLKLHYFSLLIVCKHKR